MVLLQNYFNKRVPLFFYFFVTYVLLHNKIRKDFLEKEKKNHAKPVWRNGIIYLN